MERSEDPTLTLESGITRDPLSSYLTSLRFVVNRCGHQHDDPAAEASARVIGDLELIYFRGGTGRIVLDGSSLVCGSGSLVIIPPYAIHEIRTVADDPHDNYWIHFDVLPIYERDRFTRLLVAGGTHLHVEPDGLISRALELIGSAIDHPARGNGSVLTAALQAVCALLGARSPVEDVVLVNPSNADRSVLDRAIAFAEHHLSDQLSVESLAREAGCSRSRLFEVFRSQFGHSPMAVIRWIRVRNAERLLRSTALSVKEISARVGIASQFHLSRLISEQYGMSPRALRTASHAFWTPGYVDGGN